MRELFAKGSKDIFISLNSLLYEYSTNPFQDLVKMISKVLLVSHVIFVEPIPSRRF